MEIYNEEACESTARLAVPFIKIPNKNLVISVGLRRPKEGHCISEICYECSLSFEKFLIKIAKRFGSSTLRYFFIICSILSVLGHIIFQSFLLNLDEYKELSTFLTTLLIFTIIFFLANIAFMSDVIVPEEPCVIKVISYVLSMTIYANMNIKGFGYLYNINRTQAMISLLIFILGINVFWLYASLYGYHCIGFFLASLIKSIEKCVKSKSRSVEKKRELNDSFNAYYFDSTKTTVTDCIICSEEFVENEAVYVGRCHETHIFHRNCFAEWIKVELTCPSCKDIADFY